MTFDDQDVLQRFHRALVREIQGSNPDHLTSPFTVAEIYQNLVPYRTHRDELGVEMNADYEHALLRLLAGEGDFLTIESKTARKEIKEELESPNPNTGLFRDFAAADVRLNPNRLEEVLSDPEFREACREEADAPDEGGEAATMILHEDSDAFVEALEPEDSAGGSLESDRHRDDDEVSEPMDEGSEPGEGPDSDSFEDGADVVDEIEEEEGGEGTETVTGLPFENCPWCRENLPQRPGVKFCPFCGSNVQLVPCPECGEELELNWRFCVACGTEVAS